MQTIQTTYTSETLAIELKKSGFRLYETRSSYPKVNAQENLNGKNYYVTDGTIRSFNSRIITTKSIDNGLIFGLVESVYKYYTRTQRGFRFVLFDVYGNGINRDTETYYSSSKKALDAMWVTVNALDAVQVTLNALLEDMQRTEKKLADLHAIIAGF